MPPRTKKSASVTPPVAKPPDRLPQWLYERYGQPRFRGWEHLSAADKAGWQAEADKVREAVKSNGHVG